MYGRAINRRVAHGKNLSECDHSRNYDSRHSRSSRNRRSDYDYDYDYDRPCGRYSTQHSQYDRRHSRQRIRDYDPYDDYDDYAETTTGRITNALTGGITKKKEKQKVVRCNNVEYGDNDASGYYQNMKTGAFVYLHTK